MRVLLVVFVILCAPIGGCFGESSDSLGSTKLGVGPETLISGVFQEVVLTAEMDLSVLVPYLVKDSGSGFVQNSTLLDMDRGDELTIEVLAPPRTETFVLLLGAVSYTHLRAHETDS